MVELYLVPLLRGVTGVALVSITTFVDVVNLVAADTFFRSVLEFLVDMTRSTIGFLVRAFQREIGFLVVIEV